MSRSRILVVAVSAAAVWGAGALTAAGAAIPAVRVAAAGSWGRAIGVPGLGALSTGGQARVLSVSCASAGNCAAGGAYRDGVGHVHAFVVNERNGRWGRAIEVPGLSGLNKGGYAEVASVSCAAAGNCAAGGYYTNRPHYAQGFVAVERHGRWGRAIELSPGRSAHVTSVSCASAGNCAAGGDYQDRHLMDHGFVAGERDGVWGKAIEVPGLAALSPGKGTEVTSVSCGSAGNCAAGGWYVHRSGFGQGVFVAGERDGVWGKAIEVPGLGTLNERDGDAYLLSVSCGSAGNCAAGGWYTGQVGAVEGFVADQRNGRWDRAIEVPGLGTLNKRGDALVKSVSCGSAGNCAAAGNYVDGHGQLQGYVAGERNGAWGKAIAVPGLAALNTGGSAYPWTVSCGSAGNCAAGGYYLDRHDNLHGFVAAERDGVWGRAIQVPGLAALNKANASVNSVSCPPAGRCAAGGYYAARLGHQQGFVTR